MKLSKKVLSCLLAVLMIVSSISVSFTVFGAYDQYVNSLVNAVESNYEGLIESVNNAVKHPERVPQSDGTGKWKVEVDTYTSGWLSVALAFAGFVTSQAKAGANRKLYTYADFVDAALEEIRGKGGELSFPYDHYAKILEYFRFGYTEKGSFQDTNRTVTLNIGTGYDLLAWQTIDDIEENRHYQTGTFTFRTAAAVPTGGYGLSDVQVKLDDVVNPEKDQEVKVIKNVLLTCVAPESFQTWFGMDLDKMTVDEIMALVQGDTSCAKTLEAFETVAKLSSVGDPAKLWDHYVAPIVGKSYAKTQEWVNSGLLEAINKAYAADYQRRFDEKMNTSYEGLSAAETLDHYKSIVEIMNEYEAQTNYKGELIKDEIAKYFPQGYITKVSDYIAELKTDVARAYALEFADEFFALVKEEVPTYDHESEEAADAWETSEEKKQAQDFLDRASVMITKIDNYILGYASFADVENTFTADGHHISKADYETLKKKITSAELDCNGASYYKIKAAMDSFIELTTHAGKRIVKLQDDVAAFKKLLNQAVAFENDSAKTDIFNSVFPDGLGEYEDYLNSLLSYIADRFFELNYTVQKYHDAAGGVVYGNFEAIIDSYNAVGAEGSMTSVGELLTSNGYAPKNGQRTIAQLQAIADEAAGYFRQADNFRSNLNSLANRGSNNDRQILNNIFTGTNANKWQSIMNKLSYDEIQKFVSEIKLEGFDNINLTQVADLLDDAVGKLDKVLISDDLTSILSSLIVNEDGTTGFGTWAYDYSFKDANNPNVTIRVKAGDKIKNVREMLINTVITLLFSGDLQTMLVQMLYPVVGEAVYKNDQDLGGGVGFATGQRYMNDLVPEVTRASLPLMPHWFVDGWNGNNIDAGNVQWYKFFTGQNFGNTTKYDYSNVLRILNTARRYTNHGNGTATCSYWNDSNDIPGRNGPVVTGIPASEWERYTNKQIWHITDIDGLYHSLAAALCGLAVPLATILTGNENDIDGHIRLLGGADVTATIKLFLNDKDGNQADRLYDRLFIPLYRALGVEPYSASNPRGFRDGDYIKNVACARGTTNGQTPSLVNYGVTLVEAIFDPLIGWLEDSLFVNPVSTIISILPNLLAALDYNQILPKLSNLWIQIDAQLVIYLNITKLDLSSIILPLLDGLGLDLRNGLNNLLPALLKMLMPDIDTPPSLSVPVNRFMAAGEVKREQYLGCGGWLQSWHIYADKGDVLLTLLRWLLDDGTLYKVLPLLEGLIPPAEDGSNILDTITPILDGQADLLAAVLVCLLNDYVVDYDKYYDAVADGTFTDKNGENYMGKFKLGDFLTESLGVPADGKTGLDKADLAVDNIDVIVQSLVPTIVGLLGDTLDGIGMGSVADRVNSGELETIEDIVMQGVISNDLITMVMQLLFGTRTADGVKAGVLGGFLGDSTSIVVRLLGALAEFGIDITPLGFYKAAGGTTNFGGHSVAIWLAREAEFHAGVSVPKTGISGYERSWYEAELAKMTWGDIGTESGFKWIDFAKADSNEAIWSALSDFLCTLLTPLNPLLALILCDEELTILDKLTIQGNKGYGRSIVPILDALGLESKTMTQKEYNKYVYAPGSVDNDGNPQKGANRFAVMQHSPLAPVFDALGLFLVGDSANNVKGLLDSPVAVLFEKLPNAAYFLYEYEENGEETNNLSKAVGNLIAPVIKLLKIADPILARVLNIDIQKTLNQYLDLEELIDTLLVQLLGNEDTTIGGMIDFGRIAADSSTGADQVKTNREGFSTFTKFNSTKGQLLITLIRNLFTPDLVNMVAEIINKSMNWEEVTNPDEVEAQKRISKIITTIAGKLSSVPPYAANGAKYIDLVTGIIIDVLTDYKADDGQPYFYQIMNGIADGFDENQAWKDYEIEHAGYDWDEKKLDKTKVEKAIDNMDYVISKAVPDVLAALEEEGMLGELPFDLKVVENGGLWAVIQGLLTDNVLSDDIFNMVANLVIGLLGGIDLELADTIIKAVKAVGFDITPESMIEYNGRNSQAFGYITYGFSKGEDGKLVKRADGKYKLDPGFGGGYAELSWEQIYLNHSHVAYKYNEDGTLVIGEDGNPVKRALTTTDEETGEEVPVKDENGNIVYARDIIESGYDQIHTNDGYIYTYVNDDGEETDYASQYQWLKAAKIGGKVYTLTAKYTTSAANANWSWGLTDADFDASLKGEALYAAKKDKFIANVWEIASVFAPIISAFLAGDGLKLLNNGLNLEGGKAYEIVILPIFRALGLDQILTYLSETKPEGGKSLLEQLNDGKAESDKIHEKLLEPEEFYRLVYGGSYNTADQAVDIEGMGAAFATLINDILHFVEILVTYPVETLTTAMPTLAYFIYGDGLSTVLENILVPVTTLTNRLQEIANLSVNNIGAGLLDVLITGSWAEFQNALLAFVEVDDNGNIIIDDSKKFSLTESLFALLTGMEFDLSSILAGGDDNIEDGEYSYGFMLFIDKDKELEAKEYIRQAAELEKKNPTSAEAKELRAKARAARTGALRDFFKSIAALGDPHTSGAHKGMVDVKGNGQVPVSKAEVLMFILNFVFENTTLKEILGGVLGYDITDENGDDAELLDEIITNVFQNPEVLVGVIVDILTEYEVKAQQNIVLIPITDNHYPFHEDLGYATHEDVLEAIKGGADVSEISRIKTSAAIDNLDSLVGTVLNLFKDTLLKQDDPATEDVDETGPLASIGVPSDLEDLSLKNVVDALLENMVFSDDTLNSIMGMLVGALGAKESSQTVNIILKILDGAGYSIVPQTFKTNVSELTDVIGDSTKWSQVLENNLDEKGNVSINVQWNITTREQFIDLVCRLISPLHGILEALLTGGSITVYDKINIRGFKGYEGVILPIINALGVSKLKDSEGKAYLENYYADYESFEKAVYGEDGNGENYDVLLTVLTDAVFALVDSLCDRPVSTLATVLPYLSHFLASDAVDVVIENLLTPVTTITEKIDKIYSLDILGMLKDMLRGVVKTQNEEAGVKTAGYEPEKQKTAGAMFAAYLLDVIEDSESSGMADNFAQKAFANLAETENEPEAQSDDETKILDIVWLLLESIVVNGVKLSDIVPTTIFVDLASLAWSKGAMTSEVFVDEDRRGGSIHHIEAEEYTVDRESVLLQVLNLIVFTDGIRDLIGSLANMDFDLENLTGKDDPNYLLVVLINGIFQSPEAAERLIIDLLSWYEIEYQPARIKDESDYTDLNPDSAINYEAAGIDKAQLEKLPADLDSLIAAIVPAVIGMLPEGTLGGLNLTGANLEEMVHNLVADLLKDKQDAPGYAAQLVSMLVGLIGGNETVGMVLPMVAELTGIDLSLGGFMKASPALNDYFTAKGRTTWADAYELLDADGNLPDTNSFGIEDFDDVLLLIGNVLTPLAPVFRLLLSETNLVLLDGVTITAGDGYDRLIVPVLEAFGIENVLDKNAFAALPNDQYVAQILGYLNAFITKVVTSPIATVVDALPQLVFFIYSNGLAQGIEQFLAPIITLVDMVNDITAKEVEKNGQTYVALDIYGMLLDLINEKVMSACGLKDVETVEEFINAFLTADGLEALFEGLITSSGTDIDQLGFEFKGLFKSIIEMTCTIEKVSTVRFFGTIEGVNSQNRHVMGAVTNRADTLMKIVGDTILGGDLIKNLLGVLGVELDDTISTVIDAVTGENKYVIFKVLLKYFNEYDVETMVLEYLSFEKLDYDYEGYTAGTTLTQRKVRRAIKKLDGSILSAVPGLLPMLEENETFKALIEKIGGLHGQSLKDFVHEVLEAYAFNDSMVTELLNMILGLLGGEDIQGTLGTVLPLVDQIVSIDLTPAGFAEKSSGPVKAMLEAAVAEYAAVTDENGETTTDEARVTWANVAEYFTAHSADYSSWGIDGAATFEAKKNAFVTAIFGIVEPLVPLLQFLLCGRDIQILDSGNGGVITLKGNAGYQNALYPLFQALALDQFDSEGVLVAGKVYCSKSDKELLGDIVDAVLLLVDTLCDKPVEYLLTMLPTLSYFISNNGIQVVLNNLLSPALALLNLAQPVVGSLIEDLIGKNLGPVIGDYMPEGSGTPAVDADGNAYRKYSVTDITGIAGEDGSNLIRIANELLGKLLIKDGEGNVTDPIQILPDNFFASYAEHTITIPKSDNSSKWYYWYNEGDKVVKVPENEFNFEEHEGDIVDSRYVVTGNIKADPADSLVFLLDSVLTEDIIKILADLLKLDLTDESNMIAVLLGGLAQGEVNGLVITDLVTSLFENYTITYPELNGEYITLDHSHYEGLTLSESDRSKLDQIPSKLDSIIEKAIPAVLPLISKLAQDGTIQMNDDIKKLLGTLGDAVANADTTDGQKILPQVVEDLLDEMLFTNGMASTIARLLPTLFGMDIFKTIMPILSATGFVIEPQQYLATIKKDMEGNDDAAEAIAAMEKMIGQSKTWADVLANNTAAEGETLPDLPFGIKDAADFKQAVAVIIDPLYPLLQALTMGKKLTLFSYSKDRYEPVDPDDAQDGTELGHGYVELVGVKLYEQGILPIIEALGASNRNDEILSPAAFDQLNCTQFVFYVFSLIEMLVDDLAENPVQFLSRNLAAVLYYIGNDNVYKLTETALQLVNALLKILDPVAGEDGVKISLDMVKLEGKGGLLDLLNGLLADAGVDIKLTKKMIFDLAGKLGEYEEIATPRTTANIALVDPDGKYVDKNGNELTEDQISAKGSVITTLVGKEKYFLTGLLDFVLADGLLAGFINTDDMSEAVKEVIDNVTGPDAVENVVKIILKLLNKYLVEYKAIPDAENALTKLAVDYSRRTVTKEDTQKAIENLDSMVGSLLAAFGADSIEGMLDQYLYNDDTVNLIVGALVDLLAGLDESAWDTVDMVLGLVKELTGFDINISPVYYATSDETKEVFDTFIGDAKTWAAVKEKYADGYNHAWGVTAANSAEAKTEKLVSVLSALLRPLDPIVELILAGGVNNPAEGDFGQSLGLFGEINIMGGSGYNYAVIPLLEAFGVENIKSQAEYTADAEVNGSLSYILTAILSVINQNIQNPVSYIIGLVANLAYLISKDGLTTIISNLIAPVNELIRAISGVAPISVALNLQSLITEDQPDVSKIIKFYIGSDVEKNGAEVGIFIDLNAETLEDLVAAALKKFVPQLHVDLSFRQLAAKSALTDENGAIIFTDSAVEPTWDRCNGTPGRNIEGDAADTLIAITELILTSENIEGVLNLLGVDLSTLDGAIKDLVDKIIGTPSLLADIIIKLLLGEWGNAETNAMVFKYLGEVDYDYRGDLGERKNATKGAIEKLDRIINNNVYKVIDVLSQELPDVELIAELKANSDSTSKLADIVDYLLSSKAFNNGTMNTIIGAVVNGLGGLDEATLGTINSVLDKVFDITLDPQSFTTVKGGKLAEFIGDAKTWADVAKDKPVDKDGKLAYDWEIDDKDDFFGIIYEITPVLENVLSFLLLDKDLTIVIEEFTVNGFNLYKNVIDPIAKALGIELEANPANATKALESFVDGLFGFVERLEDKPVSTILEVLGGLAYFIANNGVAVVAGNLVNPIMQILSVAEGLFGRTDVNALLKDLIGLSLDDIIGIAGEHGEKLVARINSLIGDVQIAGPDGTAQLVQLLPDNFFVEMSQYVIDPKDPGNPDVGDTLKKWTVDKTDVLMYILKTVFTKETLAVICKLANLDTNEEVASIVTGLAGKQDGVIDIILKLLTEYTITYNLISQAPISKVHVSPKDPLTDENIMQAIKAIDGLVPTILGLVTGSGDGLEALLTGLITELDVGNLVMNMLVPALSGIDLGQILGYVKQFSSIDLDLDPQAFTKGKAGSKLADFIGDAQTWAAVAEKYAQFVYTYTDENGEKAEYLSKTAGLTAIPETETALTPVMNGDVQATKMNSEFDWQLESLSDVENLLCDLLAPLDLVFKVILSGEDIIILPDTNKTEDKDQIKVTGGNGYNYGIIPILEAFGITPLNQAQYDARVKADGSSIKCILDQVFGLVHTLCDAPVETLLSMLANIFYFIGSDGINVAVRNLIAPVNEVLGAVDGVFPIAIAIDMAKLGKPGESPIATYLGKEHPGVPAGIYVNVSGADLAAGLNDLIGSIKIGDATIELSLELDWNRIAAMMAKTEDPAQMNVEGAKLEKIATKQDPTIGIVEDITIEPYQNITGDAVDTFVALLQVILTPENTEGIANLVKSLLPADLDPVIAGVVNDILSDPDAIEKLIGVVILIVTGVYEVDADRDYVYKYLGKNDEYENNQEVEAAIDSLDRVIGKALPAVIAIFGDTTKPADKMSIIDKLAAHFAGENPTLEEMVTYLLEDLVFTNGTMETITSAVINAFAGFLTEDMANTIKSLLDLDLAPAAFAAATGNAAVTAYVTGATTWADVVKNNTADGKLAPVFTDVGTREKFVKALVDLLKPFDSLLGFLLTGEDLEITLDGTQAITLKGGNAYAALKELLLRGLGLAQLGAVDKTAANAHEAIDNTISYVFTLLDEICETPFKAILSVVGNLSFFIANGDLDIALKNMLAPVLGILDVVEGVIPRAQLDGLLKGFIGVSLTEILDIGQNDGANIVKLVNGLLGKIEIKDENGETIFVLNALKNDFFKTIAKAAIRIDELKNPLLGQNVKQWHVETGSTLLAVLNSVLTNEFLTVLCGTIGIDKSSDIGQILISLAGKGEELVGVLLKFLAKYLVKYNTFTQPNLEKIDIAYSSDTTHAQLNAALGQLDALVPTILTMIGDGTAEKLSDLIYPLILTDDIANTLVSTIVSLLSGLPSETIDPIIGYVNQLTNLTDFSIAPAAFAKAPFGSKLGAYIDGAKTWADVWNAHSKVTGKDEKGNDIRTALPYNWGINSTKDLINLVCDMLNPLDEILQLLLMGGTDRAEFETNGTHSGSKITAFDEINVMGGDGYNYAVLPLLSALGVNNAKSQAEYEAYVKANKGSTLHYVLTALFNRVDDILDEPIANLLPMLANLCYILGNDNLEKIVQNLLAPVNNIIAAIDPLIPIAININLGNLAEGKEIAEIYLAKPHVGIEAGIQISLKGGDLANLINNLLATIDVNGKPLGIKLDLDWLKLAAKAGADANGDKFVDMAEANGFTNIYDIYDGGESYKSVVGDPGDTFVTILELILTEENFDRILDIIGQPDGFGEPLDSIIDSIINDPSKIIDIIISILGGGSVNYIPVQNRPIVPLRFDYSSYFLLTEPNADIIANNLDDLIIKIMGEAGVGSIKQLVYGNYITNATINQLLDMIVPALSDPTVGTILTALKEEISTADMDLDLTVQGFYKKFIDNNDYYADMSQYTPGKVMINNGAAILAKAANKADGTWADVGSFAGTSWGFRDGDLQGFLRVLTDVLTPLNSLLKFLLIGENAELNILDLIKLGGSSGYDYGIIPILEAFGINDLITAEEYKALCEKDHTQVIGYILTKIGEFADKLLDRPVDVLLTILPNVAYFISNEGLYLSVRNLLAPVFSIIEVLGKAYDVDFAAMLNISKLLHNIDFGIEVLAAKYDFRIPEINFFKLAQLGGRETQEVRTARSLAANSFAQATNPYPYITEYARGEKYDLANKTTQTYIVSDKGDTITLVLTWLLEMFGDQHNRDALVNWLGEIFMLDSGAKQTVAYGINRLFDTCSRYDVPDIIVAALFEALGITIFVDAAFSGDIAKLQQIFEEIFGALGSNDHCVYGSIAKVMQKITGIWNENFGSDDDFHEAEEEAKETLNWFQKLIKQIREFFEKIFSIFR